LFIFFGFAELKSLAISIEHGARDPIANTRVILFEAMKIQTMTIRELSVVSEYGNPVW